MYSTLNSHNVLFEKFSITQEHLHYLFIYLKSENTKVIFFWFKIFPVKVFF